MEFVAALDRVPGMRAGARPLRGRVHGRGRRLRAHDRASRRSRCSTSGPGFANGIANLHNARRARAPIVNLVGDHASWHLPLRRAAHLATSSRWRGRYPAGCAARASAKELARDAAEAIRAALDAARPGGDADRARRTAPGTSRTGRSAWRRRRRAARCPTRPIAAVARALRGGAGAALPRRRGARRARTARRRARRGGQRLPRAVRHLLHAPGARRRPARLRAPAVLPGAGARGAAERAHAGGGRARASRSASSATGTAAAGSHPTRARSRCSPRRARTSRPRSRRSRSALGARAAAAAARGARPARPSGPLDPAALGQALAALQPEGAIVVDEAATSGRAWTWALGRGASTHGAVADRRRDRPGPALRHRSRGRLPGPQGDRLPGGRLGHVHAAGAVDLRARVARRGGDRLRQPRLPHPPGRARARRASPSPVPVRARSPTSRAPSSTGSRWRADSAYPGYRVDSVGGFLRRLRARARRAGPVVDRGAALSPAVRRLPEFARPGRAKPKEETHAFDRTDDGRALALLG